MLIILPPLVLPWKFIRLEKSFLIHCFGNQPDFMPHGLKILWLIIDQKEAPPHFQSNPANRAASGKWIEHEVANK